MVLAAGHRVLATARNPDQLADLRNKYRERIHTVSLDVTSEAQAKHAVDTAIANFGGRRVSAFRQDALAFLLVLQSGNRIDFGSSQCRNKAGRKHNSRKDGRRPKKDFGIVGANLKQHTAHESHQD
jgi:NAD(P)-dependent dehydrogenase (short-subunit alcohol dehydrogenase family)